MCWTIVWLFIFPSVQLLVNEELTKYSLASAEIYVCLARIFGEFDMKLFDTEREDLEQVHDFFSPFPRSSKGLRVVLE